MLAMERGWHGKFVNSSSGGCVLDQGQNQNVQGENQTPWQKWVDFAKILLTLSLGLLTIAGIMALIPWTKSIAYLFAYAACAAAALLTMVGLAIIGMGQTKQGLIFTGIGAVLTALAWWAASSGEQAPAKEEVVKDGAKDIPQDVANKLTSSQTTFAPSGSMQSKLSMMGRYQDMIPPCK